ncbi:M14 family zinc carboxypeptidase [Streptacidiphilus sp. MAP5-52]|uniref:M14 family zinc carboxypeptidase n=1 Tax=Streptacidiphilus sp. MAP5-52 TaxID=3156267 RepID=UPI0035141C51
MGKAARDLAARHPDRCRLLTVGRSRAGQPLELLTVGDAPRRALVVAGAHANECVGGATVLELARRVLAEPAEQDGIGWDFLLCLDPDGARLVDCAGQEPQDLLTHLRGFYRPAGEEQPEWAPSVGAALPESEALLRVIEERHPFLQCSLHGTDVGGTFVQSTRHLPGLERTLAASATEFGIPVEDGPYDAFYWPSPAPGVFVMPPDNRRTHTHASSRELGTTTWHAPTHYGGETVIVEVPLWTSTCLADTTPCPDPGPALTAAADRLRARAHLLSGLLARLRDRGPLTRGARSALGACAPLADEWDPRVSLPGSPELPPVLSGGRVASLELWSHRIPLRAAAMLRRCADAPSDAELRNRLDGLLRAWCAEYAARFDPRWLPIDRQVEHQLRLVRSATSLAAAGLRR